MKNLIILILFIIALAEGAALYSVAPNFLQDGFSSSKTSKNTNPVKDTIINAFMVGEAMRHFSKECFSSIADPSKIFESYFNYLKYGGCAVTWKEVKKISEADLKDGWGNNLEFYSKEGQDFIRSLGKDKRKGGSGENEDLIYNITNREFL